LTEVLPAVTCSSIKIPNYTAIDPLVNLSKLLFADHSALQKKNQLKYVLRILIVKTEIMAVCVGGGGGEKKKRKKKKREKKMKYLK